MRILLGLMNMCATHEHEHKHKHEQLLYQELQSMKLIVVIYD